eukprot:4822540-Lingulodinium_polyedra.AAC.1
MPLDSRLREPNTAPPTLVHRFLNRLGVPEDPWRRPAHRLRGDRTPSPPFRGDVRDLVVVDPGVRPHVRPGNPPPHFHPCRQGPDPRRQFLIGLGLPHSPCDIGRVQ